MSDAGSDIFGDPNDDWIDQLGFEADETGEEEEEDTDKDTDEDDWKADLKYEITLLSELGQIEENLPDSRQFKVPKFPRADDFRCLYKRKDLFSQHVDQLKASNKRFFEHCNSVTGRSWDWLVNESMKTGGEVKSEENIFSYGFIYSLARQNFQLLEAWKKRLTVVSKTCGVELNNSSLDKLQDLLRQSWPGHIEKYLDSVDLMMKRFGTIDSFNEFMKLMAKIKHYIEDLLINKLVESLPKDLPVLPRENYEHIIDLAHTESAGMQLGLLTSSQAENLVERRCLARLYLSLLDAWIFLTDVMYRTSPRCYLPDAQESFERTRGGCQVSFALLQKLLQRAEDGRSEPASSYPAGTSDLFGGRLPIADKKTIFCLSTYKSLLGCLHSVDESLHGFPGRVDDSYTVDKLEVTVYDTSTETEITTIPLACLDGKFSLRKAKFKMFMSQKHMIIMVPAMTFLLYTHFESLCVCVVDLETGNTLFVDNFQPDSFKKKDYKDINGMELKSMSCNQYTLFIPCAGLEVQDEAFQLPSGFHLPISEDASKYDYSNIAPFPGPGPICSESVVLLKNLGSHLEVEIFSIEYRHPFLGVYLNDTWLVGLLATQNLWLDLKNDWYVWKEQKEEDDASRSFSEVVISLKQQEEGKVRYLKQCPGELKMGCLNLDGEFGEEKSIRLPSIKQDILYCCYEHPNLLLVTDEYFGLVVGSRAVRKVKVYVGKLDVESPVLKQVFCGSSDSPFAERKRSTVSFLGFHVEDVGLASYGSYLIAQTDTALFLLPECNIIQRHPHGIYGTRVDYNLSEEEAFELEMRRAEIISAELNRSLNRALN